MATILAHIQVHPGAEARFEAIAARLYEATHEQETGVGQYQYWRGRRPGFYYALLAFDDHRAFIAHQASAHHEAATPELGEVIAEMRLEWVDPVPGASPLGPTTHQAAPAGADDDLVRITELFAARVADWWGDVADQSS
ncbi:MAG: putative quinol monooxygenase [Acidimicrobiales bacterium]